MKKKYKCEDCGALVKEDAKECTECGAKFEIEQKEEEEPEKEQIQKQRAIIISILLIVIQWFILLVGIIETNKCDSECFTPIIYSPLLIIYGFVILNLSVYTANKFYKTNQKVKWTMILFIIVPVILYFLYL